MATTRKASNKTVPVISEMAQKLSHVDCAFRKRCNFTVSKCRGKTNNEGDNRMRDLEDKVAQLHHTFCELIALNRHRMQQEILFLHNYI